MKRLCLVWFVGLCLPMNAVSAPFVHLHADAAHDTDHHDGRVVHRHVTGHATVAADPHHDHDDSAANEWSSAESPAANDPSPEPTARMGSQSARLPVLGLSLAPPEVVREMARPAGPLTPAPDDVGPRLSSPLELAPSSLRGPPR